MRNPWNPLLLGVCLAAALASCGRVAGQGPASPSSSVPTEVSVPFETPPEDEDPYAACPYGIDGLTLYEPGEETQPGGLTLLATLQNDATCRDGYFWLQNLYDLPGDNLVLIYSVSDQQLNLEGDPYQDYVTPQLEKYLVSFDMEKGEVTRKLLLPEETGMSYMEQAGDVLWNWELTEEQSLALGYDGSLGEAGRLNCEADTYGSFSVDGEYFYTVSDNVIWRYPCEEGGEAERIELEQSFSVNYLSGIFRGPEDQDYGIALGMAADLKTYNAIVNLNTGEFEYLSSGYDAYLYADNGALIAQSSRENGMTNTVYTGTVPYTYDWSGEEYLNMTVLSGEKLLFYYTETNGDSSVIHMNLYDGNTGELLGGASLAVDQSYAWFNGSPVAYPGQDALLLPVGSAAPCTWYYRWDYGESAGGIDSLTNTEAQLPDQLICEIDGQWDPSSFVPQECPEELSDLRERADALEEELGIGIYLSTECRNIIGDYAMEDISDRESVELALDQLEYEAKKYPEGFFRQFSCGWVSGIDVYLAGQLIGTSSDVLEYAGGFQTTEGGRLVLVIDCTSYWNITTTFHHELSHAIDSKINMDVETASLDGEEWAALNPSAEKYGDSYTYTYTQFGRPEMQRFTYNGVNNENAYFIDDYSMTFPTEDRARLFENIMADESARWVDWDSAPHLRAKLNYFARCIRAAFDTTGWGEVPWECFLEEDEAYNNAA